MEEKKYGLIHLSKIDKTKSTLKKNIFDSDSDEEIQNNTKKVSTSSGIRRQTQLDISRALTEDPNVFEYDSIYDDMKSQKESDVAIDSEAKEKPKAKYINSLLKFSENRKKENERRVERKIQKERENEGNQFEDKEQFVTNAYKEKLNEMKVADERDRREEAIEELLDVKKQKDMSGFYRHLLNGDISSSERKDLISETPDSSKEVKEEEEVSQNIPKSIPKSKNRQIRQIRKRRNSSSDESSEETPKRTELKVESKEKPNDETIIKKEEESGSESESEDIQSDDEKQSNNDLNGKQNSNKSEEKVEKTDETNKIPKLNKRELLLKIFTKRTVGDTFSEAQMRYFQRKDNYVI